MSESPELTALYAHVAQLQARNERLRDALQGYRERHIATTEAKYCRCYLCGNADAALAEATA